MSGETMRCIWCCTCGHEEEVPPEAMRLGQVHECPACKEITAHVRRRSGYSLWVPLDREMATGPYYDLLAQPEPEEVA